MYNQIYNVYIKYTQSYAYVMSIYCFFFTYWYFRPGIASLCNCTSIYIQLFTQNIFKSKKDDCNIILSVLCGSDRYAQFSENQKPS